MLNRIRKFVYDSNDALAPSHLFVPFMFDAEGEGGGGDDGAEGGENGPPDDDEDGNDEGADDDGDDEGADDKGKPKTFTQKDIDKLTRSARRARAEAARWRRIAQGKQNDDGGGGDADGDGQKGPDYRAAAVVSTAYTALKEAGFTGSMSKAQRILRDFEDDLKNIEPDGRGYFDPDDFGDVIAEVQDEWSELFEQRGRRRSRDDDEDDDRPRRRSVPRPPSSRRQSSSSTSGGGGRQLTADERFAQRALQAAGFTTTAKNIGRR